MDELRVLQIYSEHADTVSSKYYFGCIQVNFETVKKFAGDQLKEKSSLVQQWLNEHIIQQCNQKFKTLEKVKIVLFTVPQSPPALIELKKTIKNLRSIIK